MTIFTTQNKKDFFPRAAGKLLSAVFWVAVWELLCYIVKQEILIVSPVRVLTRLWELSGDAAFWLSALNSMLHVLAGFLLGLLAGILLAVLSSSFRFLSELLFPLVSIIKATPVVSFIILALVWIRSEQVPMFTAFLEVTPIALGNVMNGILKTDPKLLEMVRVYRFGPARTLRRVYIPSVMPYFTAACTTGMGLAWKTCIAAEVLASTDFSIGGHIYDSKVYLETADLFAWTAVVVMMSVLLERLMMRMMRKIGKKYNID